MVKREKRARKKRLIKQIESLLERAEEHKIKAETEKGSKDTTPGYWIKEAEGFEEQAKEKEEILEKLDNKRAESTEISQKQADNKWSWKQVLKLFADATIVFPLIVGKCFAKG